MPRTSQWEALRHFPRTRKTRQRAADRAVFRPAFRWRDTQKTRGRRIMHRAKPVGDARLTRKRENGLQNFVLRRLIVAKWTSPQHAK